MNKLDRHGDTLLHRAVRHDYTRGVNKVIEAGADVNKRNGAGLTTLMLAVKLGLDRCVDILIKGGADVNVLDGYGNTILMCAAKSGYGCCVKRLIEAGAGVNKENMNQCLLLAAYKGNAKFLDAIMNTEAYVNKRDRCKDIALIVATENAHGQCVDILVKKGADVNARKINGDSALICAVKNGNGYCISALIQAGAGVNTRNYNYETALTLAVKKGQFVQSLVHAGADVNYQGWIILWCTARRDDIVNMKILLRAGIHINQPEMKIVKNIWGLKIDIDHAGPNVLTKYLRIFDTLSNPEVIILLYAAGETINMADVVIPDYLELEIDNTLMNICRTSVRTHLLVASRVNLFVRIPRLGLPKLLQSFLLYDMKL